MPIYGTNVVIRTSALIERSTTVSDGPWYDRRAIKNPHGYSRWGCLQRHHISCSSSREGGFVYAIEGGLLTDGSSY
jgi:hypothetical protein